jgi:hypothetical protein
MTEPTDQDEIARSRERAIAAGTYLLIPGDVTNEELEIYAAILDGRLPFSAQPRPAPTSGFIVVTEPARSPLPVPPPMPD